MALGLDMGVSLLSTSAQQKEIIKEQEKESVDGRGDCGIEYSGE
jgi:hypothetical protein